MSKRAGRPGSPTELAQMLGLDDEFTAEEFTNGMRTGYKQELAVSSEHEYPTDEMREHQQYRLDEPPFVFGYMSGVLKARHERSEGAES